MNIPELQGHLEINLGAHTEREMTLNPMLKCNDHNHKDQGAHWHHKDHTHSIGETHDHTHESGHGHDEHSTSFARKST